MPEYIEKCPYCFQEYSGGISPALLGLAGPVSDVAKGITQASSDASKRNYEKREKIGLYEREKQRKNVEFYNQLKKQRKQGKLPPNLKTDEQLWDYAISKGASFYGYPEYSSSDDDYSSSDYGYDSY